MQMRTEALTTLPDAALDEIVRLLAGIFQARYHIDITDKIEPLKRLRRAASEIRHVLERRQRAPVSLKHLYQRHSLQAVILRSEVDAWLALSAPKPLYELTPPTLCPACRQALGRNWICQTCGLELESPYQRAQHRGSSLTGIRHLPYGHLLFADPERRRLLFLECRDSCRVVLTIEAESLNCQMPWSALCLPEHHVLVCDRQAGRVFECGLLGELFWEYDSQLSESHRLVQPLKACLIPRVGLDADERILIVDSGGHRVLVVDRQQRILWQYGERGRAGSSQGLLNAPSDAQLTCQGQILITDKGNNRLLEVDAQTRQVTWVSPAHLKLSRPVFAERLPNRHLLIVDAGNYRLLELDAEGGRVEQCRYYSPEQDPQHRMDEPIQMLRRENQHIVLASRKRVMEIDLHHGLVLWSTGLAVLNDAEDALEGPEINRKLVDQVPGDASLSQGPGLARVLRRTQVFQGAPDSFFEALPAYFTPHSFHAGEAIVSEGEPGDTMFILRSGKVQVNLRPDRRLATLEPGDVFGEMALLQALPRSSTLTAETPCEVYRLSKWAFETALQSCPELAGQIQKLVRRRIRLDKLKAAPPKPSEQVLRHLEQLHQAQLAKLIALREAYHQRLETPALVIFRPLWRLRYTRLEQWLIRESLQSSLTCFELHVHTRDGRPMSLPEASQFIQVLEALGKVIKLHPTSEALLAGDLAETLVAAVLTRHCKAQLLDDLCDLKALAPAQIHAVQF